MGERRRDLVPPGEGARRRATTGPEHVNPEGERILRLQRSAGNRAVTGMIQRKGNATTEVAILVIQAMQRGMPMTAESFAPQYQPTVVQVQESILRAMKAVVYWCRVGCLHLTAEGPEIVRPCPALQIASWIPNLFPAPSSMVKNGVESLAPKDLHWLPTIPKEYLAQAEGAGGSSAPAPSDVEGPMEGSGGPEGTSPTGSSGPAPSGPQAQGGGATGSPSDGKPLIGVRGPEGSPGGAPVEVTPPTPGPADQAPGDIPAISPTPPAQAPEGTRTDGPPPASDTDPTTSSHQPARAGGPPAPTSERGGSSRPRGIAVDPRLESLEALEVAVYMITNHIQNQPFVARGLTDRKQQTLAMLILGQMLRYGTNLTYWTNYGMAKRLPDGQMKWVRPGDPVGIALLLGIGPADDSTRELYVF